MTQTPFSSSLFLRLTIIMTHLIDMITKDVGVDYGQGFQRDGTNEAQHPRNH